MKNWFKRRRLHDIVNGSPTLYRRLIYQSFQQMTPAKVRGIIAHSRSRLFRARGEAPG